ncbi:MAG: cold shock domain-containing protein [Nocardiaceae bacterium]|nr:cold shock domain-containing protein [Nocardiaceae bacterium]
MYSEGVVREWHDEDGWGVLDSADTSGGCWAHFSAISAPGFRRLVAGETVSFTWTAVPDQDGYQFLATKIIRQADAHRFL